MAPATVSRYSGRHLVNVRNAQYKGTTSFRKGVLVRRVAFGIAVAATLFVSASAQQLNYQSPATLSTGSSCPTYMATGDFNGDGKPDIVIPNCSGETVSVYLNQGSETFGPAVVTTLSLRNTVGAILVGDINEDGKQDIVISTFAGVDSEIAIPLLGNGDGTFQQQPGIPNSFGFLSGQLTDINGDGHLDVILGCNGEQLLFLGKGDGTFSQQAIPNGSSPGGYFSIAVGDINGDKIPDVVAADFGVQSSGGSIDIFPGQAAGGFAAPTFYPSDDTLSYPETVALADFNLDHKLDLLVASPNGGAYVAVGNGDGTFRLQSTQLIPIYSPPLPSSNGSVHGLIADLNGDGKLDIAVMDGATGALTLVVNEGAGLFPSALESPYVYQLPAHSGGIRSADFNGDGLPDFAIPNEAGKFISLLLSGKSTSKPIISISSSGSAALVGSTVSLQAKFSGTGQTPTGTVTWMDGSSAIGSQQLDANGSATITTSSLGVGVHSLVASYSGDSNYSPVSSPGLSESITDFQVSVPQSLQTVGAGASATFAVAVTPVAGFSGDVTFTCSGLPALAQCGSATANVTSGPTNVNVVVTTAAATSAQNRLASKAIYYCVLLGAFSFCYASRKRRGIFAGSSSILLIAFAVGLSGCGGGSKGSSQPGTPSGTTSFTITASTTQNGTTLKHASKATLIVQ
jgi:hypothetical protein